MVKSFKNAWYRVLQNPRRMPFLTKIRIFCSDAVRIVDDRPLTTLSDQRNDLLPISPASLFGQELAPNAEFHDKGDLRQDFLFNANISHRFWLGWIKFYLPSLQRRSKRRVIKENLTLRQLVIVGDARDLSYCGAYRLGRIHCLHPQIRNSKEIVRRATVAILSKISAAGFQHLDYIL